LAVYTARPKTIETLQALLATMRIEEAEARKCVQRIVVRVRPPNAGEATVPADRKASGAQRSHHDRTKQQNAHEDCEDCGLKGYGVATQKIHCPVELDALEGSAVSRSN